MSACLAPTGPSPAPLFLTSRLLKHSRHRLYPPCPGPWSEVAKAVRTPKPGLTPVLSAPPPPSPNAHGVSTGFCAASPVTPSTRASRPQDSLAPGTSTEYLWASPTPSGTDTLISSLNWTHRLPSSPTPPPTAPASPCGGLPPPAPPSGLHSSRGSLLSAGTDLARGGGGRSGRPRASLGSCMPRLHTGYHTS